MRAVRGPWVVWSVRGRRVLCAYETIGEVDGELDYLGEIVVARFGLAWLSGAPSS